jgi:hypothetical protein
VEGGAGDASAAKPALITRNGTDVAWHLQPLVRAPSGAPAKLAERLAAGEFYFTVTFNANLAHNLTRSPKHL